MTPVLIRDFLLWCAIINFGLLSGWCLIFTLAHDWVYGLHSRWFNLQPERFDAVHYAGMALFKLSIVFFNLVPYLALEITA